MQETEETEEQVPQKKSLAQKLNNNVWFKLGKNKYLLTIIFFLTWMMFFDNNNWFYLSKLTEEAQLKQKEKAWYLREITDSEQKLHELTSDLKALEKFGRETYYMKKSNEDVFVFFSEKKDENP